MLNFNASLLRCHILDFFSDLKPNNIALTKNGHVRLIDFGHAENLQDGKLHVLPCQIPHFAAPEVWHKKLAGLASDWFAYGVIITLLYQLRLPFDGKTVEEIRKLADSDKPSLDAMRPQMGDVNEFIKKLLVADPDKRLSNVSKDKFFVNGMGVTKLQFKPRNIKIPSIKPKEGAKYFSEDQSVYEQLESSAIRIPPTDFFASDYYKSI